MNETNELELILDDCLQQIMSGAKTAEECLRRYPAQADALRPALEAALQIGGGRGLAPSASYRARGRRQLMDYVHTHPRRRPLFSPLAIRLVEGIMVALAILLLTGTAYAQNTLPGEPLYNWKLTSEKAWRAVAPDPVAVDFSIANRRADELTIVVQQKGESDRRVQAFQDYYQSLQQLQSDANPSDNGQIMQLLESHRQKFQQAGIDDPQLDAILHRNGGNNGNGGDGGGSGGGGNGGGKP